MTKIAHISRHLDSLIAGIIGGSTSSVAFAGAGVTAGKLASEDFDVADTLSFFLRSVQRDGRSKLVGGKGVAPC